MTSVAVWALLSIGTFVHAAEPAPDKAVVLTFDDAVKSQVTNVAPMLKEYGFGATFFITQRWMDDPAQFMSWDDAATLHKQGFEIGNHTWTHGDFGSPENGAKLAGELKQVEAELARVGVPKPVSFAWPGNSFGPESLAVLREAGYLFARRGMQPEIKYGEIVPGPLYDVAMHDPLLIPTGGDGYPGWTLEHFKEVVERARNGKIVVLQFHGVPDEAHPWVNTPLERFREYMAYLKQEGFHCIALRDVGRFIDRAKLPIDPVAQMRHPEKVASDAKPPLHFGRDESLPLPKTLVFSVTPDKIMQDAEAWKAIGADGFFLEGVASEWSSDIWATDGKPFTIGASDETFQKVQSVNEKCAKLGMVNFLKVVFANPLEWFNDTAWQHIDHNFRQFAIFARETGCKGVALDIEYIGQQYVFDWPGYDYKGYTREDLIEKIRERATKAISGMYDEFPDMEFLVLPEGGFALGGHIQTAWIEEAARRNAPGGVHFCMEGTYFVPELRRVLAYGGGVNKLMLDQLSPAAQEYWQTRCSLAAGMWTTGFDLQPNHDSKDTSREMRECWAGTLMISPKYNWLYVDRFGEQHVGRGRDTYTGKTDFAICNEILKKKEVVVDPQFVAVARRVRAMESTDFSKETGVTAVPRFMFPQGLPSLELTTATLSKKEVDRSWAIAMGYFRGVDNKLAKEYSPVREWQIIGPFSSGEGLQGHDKVFPPEQSIDLTAEYNGANGKVKWQPYHVPDKGLGVDFKALYTPAEQVTAYALTYVESPVEQTVQLRFGSNDSGKVWVGGKLVNDFNRESWCVLDRDIVSVTLPKGRTPVLCKATTSVGAWGLALRFTDENGRPVTNIECVETP